MPEMSEMRVECDDMTDIYFDIKTSEGKCMTWKNKKYPTEHVEQTLFVQWFRLAFPGVLIFSIPNGGERNIVVAKKLKAEGVVKGIPDLFIPEWKMFVEMKRQRGGSLSPEQREKIEYLQSVGYHVIVGKGCTHAVDQIEEFVAKNVR